MKKKLEFVRKSRREIMKTPLFRLQEDVSVHPENGSEGRYYVFDFADWVNMIAVTKDQKLITVRQWRHGTASVELEIPAGGLEAGEDPVVAAGRELLEETGYVASSARLIGEARPNCAIQGNRCFTVVLEGCELKGETKFDPGEVIEVELIPMASLASLVRNGSLRSGMMLVALLWWLDSRDAVDWPL